MRLRDAVLSKRLTLVSDVRKSASLPSGSERRLAAMLHFWAFSGSLMTEPKKAG